MSVNQFAIKKDGIQPCHYNCKSNFVFGLKGVCDSEGVDGCEALRAITI